MCEKSNNRLPPKSKPTKSLELGLLETNCKANMFKRIKDKLDNICREQNKVFQFPVNLVTTLSDAY